MDSRKRVQCPAAVVVACSPLYCYYCSTVLKSEWQWPEPFQTTERRSILVMRKWKWWRRRSLTLTVSCAVKEQWSAPGNYGVGKQWHHHHKTQNQGTSSKCTKMCINQIYALNPGFIPLLKLWEMGPILLWRKETAEGQKWSSGVQNGYF